MVLELNFKVICVFAGGGMKHRRIFKENKLMVLLLWRRSRRDVVVEVENTHKHTHSNREIHSSQISKDSKNSPNIICPHLHHSLFSFS